jgi:hypothetical protein
MSIYTNLVQLKKSKQMMETIENYFSDDFITLMIFVIPLLLAAVAFFPVYLSEKYRKRNNESTKVTSTRDKKSNKKKTTEPPFIKPTPRWVWPSFTVLFIIGLCFGVLKYLKESNNRTKYDNQNVTLNQVMDKLNVDSEYYSQLFKLTHERDSASLVTLVKNIRAKGFNVDQNLNIGLQKAHTITNVNGPVGIMDNGSGNSWKDVRTTIIDTGKKPQIITYVGHAEGPKQPPKRKH